MMPQEPSPYASDMASLDSERCRTARFFHVALHCHSPASHDWPRAGCDPALNDKQTYLAEDGECAFIEKAQQQGHLDVLAITDHMKCGYAARLVGAGSLR